MRTSFRGRRATPLQQGPTPGTGVECRVQYSGAHPVTDVHPTSCPKRSLGLPAACLALAFLAGGAPAATGLSGPSFPSVRPAPDSRATDAYTEVQRLLRSADPAGALARLESVAPEQSREPRWRFLRGVVLGELGRSAEAAAVYTALTQEFPELAEPHNNLAVLLAAQGRLDEARAALEAALRADPSHREARENLGDVYVRLAVRLWESLGAAPGRPGPDAETVRKLRLAREIGAPPP